ncbi:MAG: ComF family protein [Eubacteriales bacterium]|nr:ComF family protein [Eubacteriales bacterium]
MMKIRAFYWLKEILFPRKCMLCRDLLPPEQTDLCHKCRVEVEEYPFGALNPPPEAKNRLHFLDSFTAIWYYEGDVRKSIHRYKFQKAIHLAPKYGRLLAMRILKQGPAEFDVLTWSPVSWFRRLTRGYDQSELLAKCVGSELGIQPQRLLRKVRNTPPQSSLTKESERKANVLGAFRIAGNAEIKGKRILILDDVFTTGATSEECAKTLLLAGAKEVHCAAVTAVRYRKK